MALNERFAPDAYFTETQYNRLKELLDRRSSLTDEEGNELDALIDAELDATVVRSEESLK
jgi:hypothetical protein